jgi:hypothetical protein
MPKVSVYYTVEWSPSSKDSISTICYLSNRSLFLDLGSIGVVTNKPFSPSEKYVRYRIEADENDSIHEQVREVFRRHGIDLNTVPGFRPSRIRTYEKKEYDTFEFLCLRPAGIPNIALFAENRDGTHVLYANERLKKKLTFASEELTRVFYASEEGRGYLDAQNLVGLCWEPAVFDRPEKAVRKLFRLRSSVILPPALTRIVDGRDRDVTHVPLTEGGDRDWDSGGYRPPEIHYRRKDLDELGEFDVAVTTEMIGGMPQWYHPDVIVSPRFRKILMKMKNTSVGYNPVHLD